MPPICHKQSSFTGHHPTSVLSVPPILAWRAGLSLQVAPGWQGVPARAVWAAVPAMELSEAVAFCQWIPLLPGLALPQHPSCTLLCHTLLTSVPQGLVLYVWPPSSCCDARCGFWRLKAPRFSNTELNPLLLASAPITGDRVSL